MIDGSPNLLLAVLKSVSCESVNEYYDRCYRVVSGQGYRNDLRKGFVHQCASHFMKNASRVCNKYYSTNRKDALYWLGQLVICNNLKDLEILVYHIAVLTLSERNIPLVVKSYNYLQYKIEQAECEDL